MRVCRSILRILASLAVTASLAHAGGICQPDQTNDSQAPLQGYLVPGAGPVGQEFKPNTPSLDAVEVAVNSQNPTTPGVLRLRIRESTIAGTVLGTSEDLTIAHVSPATRALFRFSPPVPLTPGAPHVIEFVHVSGSDVSAFLSGGFGANTYSEGTAIAFGAAEPGDDFWFRTGTIDPLQRPDQENDVTLSGTVGFGGGGTVGQTFLPTTRSMDALEVQLSGGGRCIARILDTPGSPRILGVSQEVEITVAGSPLTRPRFEFDPPVPLTPGALHAFEIEHTGGGGLEIGRTPDAYAAGNAFDGGVGLPGDFWFRSGLVKEELALPDQLGDSAISSDRYVIPTDAVVGQEFVPARDSLDRVELRIDSRATLGRALVVIRAGSPAGPILGESTTVDFGAVGPPVTRARFDFDPPAPLVPGAVHFLEVVHAGGSTLGVYTTGFGANGYPAGRAIAAGSPVAGTDLWFRTGLACDPLPRPEQQNLVLSTDAAVLAAGTSIGQSFTTSTNRTEAVELRLVLFSGASANVSVRIREGSISGPVRATSNSQKIIASPPGSTRARFGFRPPVPLLNGTTYFLELVNDGPGSAGAITSGIGVDAYAGGSLILAGSPVVEDLWFREGLILDCGPIPNTSFCFGIGCPCGNDDPLAGCVNSTGSGATLGSIGSGSVSGDDLLLVANGCPPNNSGLFFMGGSVFPAPLDVGDGLGCTGGLFRFLPGSVTAGGLFLQSGIVAQAPPGTITAGDRRHFQAWTRDVLCGPPPSPCPTPCGGGSNLSAGLSVTFIP